MKPLVGNGVRYRAQIKQEQGPKTYRCHAHDASRAGSKIMPNKA